MLMTVSSALVKYFCTGAYNQTVQEQKVAHEQLDLCSCHLLTSSVIYRTKYITSTLNQLVIYHIVKDVIYASVPQ